MPAKRSVLQCISCPVAVVEAGWIWGVALSFGSLQISLKGLEFVPPVTFMLQCGTGPVYLSGQHVTCESQLGYGAG